MNLKHKDITGIILNSFYEVYNELGRGFLESVYEKSLAIVLEEKGLKVETQKEVPVFFRGISVGKFKADVVVEEKVVIELKAVKKIDPAHSAQLLNYLKATQIEVGLVLNFGDKPDFKRLVFENIRNNPRSSAKISG